MWKGLFELWNKVKRRMDRTMDLIRDGMVSYKGKSILKESNNQWDKD